MKDTAKFDYPKNICFSCIKCALCCGDTRYKVRRILLLENEAEKIMRVTGKSIDSFTEKVVGFEPYIFMIKKNADGKCVFLKNNLCSIYRIRPLICIFYPFELKKNMKNKYVFSFTNECPAIGNGTPLGEAYFASLFRKFSERMSEK